MEPFLTDTRTKITYGALALLPLAAVIYITIQLFGFVKDLSKPLAPYFGTNVFFDTLLLFAVTVMGLLAVCYMIGSVVNTQVGALTYEKIENRLREFIPGYQIIANLLRGIAGKKMSYPAALITLSAPGTAVLGFIMEDDGDRYMTIFVPTAPVMTAGAIHLVERTRVKRIEGSNIQAANCVTQWGLGLKKLRGETIPPLN
jgi:uncharacterized membrane protein